MDAIVLPSVGLATVILLGYLCAWRHDIPKLAICGIVGILIIRLLETPLEVIFETSATTRFERFMEIGPIMMLTASILLGFWYAWKHQHVHIGVCMVVAVSSLVLGW